MVSGILCLDSLLQLFFPWLDVALLLIMIHLLCLSSAHLDHILLMNQLPHKSIALSPGLYQFVDEFWFLMLC